jgi:hypothetical protein
VGVETNFSDQLRIKLINDNKRHARTHRVESCCETVRSLIKLCSHLKICRVLAGGVFLAEVRTTRAR